MDKQTTRICKFCEVEKPITKFGKIDRTRRKYLCNRCARAKILANKAGMTPEEYLSFSEGPCQLCGQQEAKAFKKKDSDVPSLRLCAHHRFVFRSFDEIEQMYLVSLIMRDFPFWIDFLRENHLHLFALDNGQIED